MKLPLRDRPAYPMAEVARYAHVPPATVRSWVVGREYATSGGRKVWAPLIKPADPKARLLSFNNLIEIHVLSAIRTEHGTPVREIRRAVDFAEQSLGIERLLLSKQLLTDGRHVFLEHLSELLNLSRSGQFAMRAVLKGHLSRVDRDDRALPMRLFPFVRATDSVGPRLIAIDPAIAFGRPVVVTKAIATRVIAERIDAGESPESVADDYEIGVSEVEAAVVYEHAA